MADTPNIPDCNPVLFLNAQGKLFLVWIAVQANHWEQSILRFRTSTDYLKSGAPIWNWQDNILLKPNDSFATEVEAKFKKLPSNNAGWAGYAPKYDQMIIEASKDTKKRSIGWMTRIKPWLFLTTMAPLGGQVCRWLGVGQFNLLWRNAKTVQLWPICETVATSPQGYIRASRLTKVKAGRLLPKPIFQTLPA